MRTSDLFYLTASLALVLVPVVRAQTPPLQTVQGGLISQAVVDAAKDRVQTWIPKDISLGEKAENSTLVGAFLSSGQELVEHLIGAVLTGVRTPIQSMKIVAAILGYPHDRLTDKIRDILDFFVAQAANGATLHLRFWRQLASIGWKLLVKLYDLLPVAQIGQKFGLDRLEEKITGLKESVSEKLGLDNLAIKMDDFKDGLTDKLDNLKEGVSDKFDGIREGVADFKENVAIKVGGLKDGLANTFDDVAEKLNDKVDGFVGKISDKKL